MWESGGQKQILKDKCNLIALKANRLQRINT
jgi:hypothetical protein